MVPFAKPLPRLLKKPEICSVTWPDASVARCVESQELLHGLVQHQRSYAYPRLVEAQVKSMGVQDQTASSILELAKQQAEANASLLPIQKEIQQFGLDASKKVCEQGRPDRFGRLAWLQRVDGRGRQPDAVVGRASR